jgi:hypothetical protein
MHRCIQSFHKKSGVQLLVEHNNVNYAYYYYYMPPSLIILLLLMPKKAEGMLQNSAVLCLRGHFFTSYSLKLPLRTSASKVTYLKS